MSLRSDILGWVIGQLGSIDAADPVARRGLYEALRGQVSREGAFGAAPTTALPHLESAIVRQEMNSLRAASFAYAVDHLESVLKLGGLSLPQGIRRLEG